MELTKFKISVILKHYQKQDYKAAAAARRTCEVEGEGVLSVWHNDGCNVSTLEKKTLRSGKPKLWDIENILRV